MRALPFLPCDSCDSVGLADGGNNPNAINRFRGVADVQLARFP